MGQPDFGALQALTTTTAKQRKGTVWEPLTIDDLADGHVLAFDQTTRSSGWVAVVKEGDRLRVYAAGVIKPKDPEMRGHEQSLVMAEDVWAEALEVIAQHPNADLVHETPPAGSRMARPESSLLAALAIRIAARIYLRTLTMLGAQPAKKLICGNANADKPTAHAALAACADWIEGYAEHITNEHKRDALLLALLHLARKKDS